MRGGAGRAFGGFEGGSRWMWRTKMDGMDGMWFVFCFFSDERETPQSSQIGLNNCLEMRWVDQKAI